jgi:Tol biopolymer transport system component
VGIPSWSPNGRLIAYTASPPGLDPDRARSSVYVVAAEGGKPKLVYRPSFAYGHVLALDWSPDARRLVLQITEDPPACMECPVPGPAPDPRARLRTGINTIDVDGRGLRRVAPDGQGPVWSPDGRWIAFRQSGAPNFALWVKPARGGSARMVLTYKSGFGGTGPTWLPISR